MVIWHPLQIVQMFKTIKKLLPSLHQHRINIDTVKHVHTMPYIFVRFNIRNFPVAWSNSTRSLISALAELLSFYCKEWSKTDRDYVKAPQQWCGWDWNVKGQDCECDDPPSATLHKNLVTSRWRHNVDTCGSPCNTKIMLGPLKTTTLSWHDDGNVRALFLTARLFRRCIIYWFSITMPKFADYCRTLPKTGSVSVGTVGTEATVNMRLMTGNRLIPVQVGVSCDTTTAAVVVGLLSIA